MVGERRELRRRLRELATGQGGYFTAAQAREVGYSHQAQAHHAAVGNWVRVDRGIFHLADWISGNHDDLARWNLWSRGRAAISHETALSVHGIGEFESADVHLTVPRNFSMRHDGVVLHSAELADADIVQQSGFRMTAVVRSLIDVAPHADLDQLGHAIEDATSVGLVTLRQLRARSEEIDVKAALQIERAIHASSAS